MKIEIGRQNPEVPLAYRKLLANVGGTNFLREPNFKLVWGESHVDYTAFGPMVLNPMPCWMLAEWHPAEEYGPPSLWPWDILGEYPSRGRYEIITTFYKRNGKEIEPMPLNVQTFEFMLPIILKHRHDSGEKRLAAMREIKERRDKQVENRIADNIQDAVGSIATDAISYAGQTNCHSYVQQMIDRMEARMGQNYRMNKGLQQIGG